MSVSMTSSSSSLRNHSNASSRCKPPPVDKPLPPIIPAKPKLPLSSSVSSAAAASRRTVAPPSPSSPSPRPFSAKHATSQRYSTSPCRSNSSPRFHNNPNGSVFSPVNSTSGTTPYKFPPPPPIPEAPAPYSPGGEGLRYLPVDSSETGTSYLRQWLDNDLKNCGEAISEQVCIHSIRLI